MNAIIEKSRHSVRVEATVDNNKTLHIQNNDCFFISDANMEIPK
jgi:hypothetical protein